MGLKSAPVRLVSHAIAQVAYDGGWHVMDGDLDSFFLLRDNETLASDRELARDHDLVKRAHTYGITLPDTRRIDEAYAAMFVCEDPVRGDRASQPKTTMNMTLRPGEALVWRWGHLTPAKYSWRSSVQPDYPDTVCNGLWEYRPDFTRRPLEERRDQDREHRQRPGRASSRRRQDGHDRLDDAEPLRLRRRAIRGGRQRGRVGGLRGRQEMGETRAEKAGYRFFSNWGPQRFQYQLRCQLSGDARLKRLAMINDLQMALLALPEMIVGENAFTYTDQSPGERKVRITHEWVERTTRRPPAARGGLSARRRPGRGHRPRFPLERPPRRRTERRSRTTTSCSPTGRT